MTEETRDFASDMFDITAAILAGKSLNASLSRKLFDLWVGSVSSQMAARQNWAIELAQAKQEGDESRALARVEFQFKYGPLDPQWRRLVEKYPWLENKHA